MKTRQIDLSDMDLFVDGDPYAAWTWLRENSPVHWNETDDGGFWALTKYDDVAATYVDATTFSSKFGTMLGGSYRQETDTASGKMLICSDPPDHRLLRQQVYQGFTQRVTERAAARIAGNLDAALQRMVDDGGCDFATDVALELPAGFVSTVFGLDRDEAFHILGLTRKMIGFRDEEYRGDATEQMTLVGAQMEIFDFFVDLLERRRSHPGDDDLVSLLIEATINGRPMSDSEILYNCLNVAVGGNETTPFTATAAVQTLAEHPGEAARLLDDPSLVPAAVQEIFRWTSTNAYVQRTVMRDTVIRDTEVAAGQVVTLWNAAANRDEEQFARADELDLGREPNRHLAFGVGTHRCIGASVATLEITILMEQLVNRRLRFELAGQAPRLRSNFMLGIKHLPVEVTVV